MRLAWITIVHRPYVLAFLAAGVWAARRDLDRRGAAWTAVAACVAGLGFELASTRWGFPFGRYDYAPPGHELYLSNVPLYTPVSYIFLAWTAIGTARFARRGRDGLWTWILSAVVFVWIDLVLDPVTVLGRRWFLGEVYRYRSPQGYLGVPLSNFGGWLLLGTVVTATYARTRRTAPPPAGRSPLAAGGILVFALAVALAIRATTPLVFGAAWTAGLAGLVAATRRYAFTGEG